ncbi:MAG: hypothetical protein ACK4RV_11720 [Caulobacter sp.]
MSEPLRLPEIQWTWRRIFTYVATLLSCVGIGWAIAKIDSAEDLRCVALALVGLQALLAVLYLTGATVTDLARLAAARAGIAPKGDPS